MNCICVYKKWIPKLIEIHFRGRWGIRTPRYGNPYVSLANWWFQPLTQPSKMLPFEAIQNVLTLV